MESRVIALRRVAKCTCCRAWSASSQLRRPHSYDRPTRRTHTSRAAREPGSSRCTPGKVVGKSERRKSQYRRAPAHRTTAAPAPEDDGHGANGEGGIRTLDGRNRPYRFSRPAPERVNDSHLQAIDDPCPVCGEAGGEVGAGNSPSERRCRRSPRLTARPTVGSACTCAPVRSFVTACVPIAVARRRRRGRCSCACNIRAPG